jgi:Lrp/AsnC family transcriptional regulator, leucine-responsive regulatory protein
MDEIDIKILNLLQENSKRNTKEIAEKIGLSVTPTFERIRKLEKQGVIQKYMAILDPSKVNKSLVVFCQVTLALHSRETIDHFKKQTSELPEVVSCFHISGNYDFLLKIYVADMNAYQHFIIHQLSTIKGISNVQSSFVLEDIKKDLALTL